MKNIYKTTAAVEYNLADKHFDRSAIENLTCDFTSSIGTSEQKHLSQTNWSQGSWVNWDGNRAYCPQEDHSYTDCCEEAEFLHQQNLDRLAEESEIDPDELRAFWTEKEAQ